MKYSVKDLIRRRLINIIVITIISLIISITYLGIHKSTVEPSEKREELQIIPNVSNQL